MINKRVLVLAFELLSLLVVIRASAHAVGYSVDVFDGTAPVIDGEMAPGEWNDASTLSFNFTIVHLKHDANNLYIAFNISDATLDSDVEGVYLGLDTSNDGGPSLNQSDDIIIGTFRNGTAFETDGMGPLPPSPGWNVSVFEEAAGYTIEFNVTYGRIGITSGENKTLGLLLLSYDQSTFQYSIWPIMGIMDVMIPSNWGDMMVVFQTGPIYIKPDGSIEGTDKIVSMDSITYTFTSDINASIVVQRSDIIIAGNGYTLSDFVSGNLVGFNLTSVSNVTIRNVNVAGFGYGIYLQSSILNIILENNITFNEGNIYLENSSDNTITDNTITDGAEAIQLRASSNNTISGNRMSDNYIGVWFRFNSAKNVISGNNITDNESGIELLGSSNSNTISGNNITANNMVGIYLDESSNNTISGNNIRANTDYGVELYGSSNNNSISGNTITDSDYGLWLEGSFNTICGNDISNNKAFQGSEGIYIGYSVKNNVVSGNNITNNYYGIELYDDSNNNTICGNNIANNEWHGLHQHASSDNFICNNNFLNNTNHVLSSNSANIWNNDVEGNYWSNYTGFDLNHDGIGDTNHTIDANNIDNYPLMGPFHSFNTSIWKSINIISNSTVDSFRYESSSTIRFHVSNTTANQTHGFCRVSIPYEVLSEPFNVTIDGANPTYWNYTLYDNGTHRWIYFEYEHSTKEVVIIPEFSFFAILPMFMTATLLTALAYRRKRPLEA
ncbi:MAG: right-handed parallel beta-helix repeat-containing protein [Candidatus Bathyarchaeota archaeon]|nr:right-handed parallel beta-helix repeat-containing protein [Candidatus Bathyarchaeota archaeon]